MHDQKIWKKCMYCKLEHCLISISFKFPLPYIIKCYWITVISTFPISKPKLLNYCDEISSIYLLMSMTRSITILVMKSQIYRSSQWSFFWHPHCQQLPTSVIQHPTAYCKPQHHDSIFSYLNLTDCALVTSIWLSPFHLLNQINTGFNWFW